MNGCQNHNSLTCYSWKNNESSDSVVIFKSQMSEENPLITQNKNYKIHQHNLVCENDRGSSFRK